MDRRTFFRRTAPIAALVAVAPVSLLAAEEAKGKLVVDGRDVTLLDADLKGGIEIHATSGVSITNCHFEVASSPAVHIASAPSRYGLSA